MSAVTLSENSVLARVARYLAYTKLYSGQNNASILKDAFLELCNLSDADVRIELGSDPELFNEILSLCKIARRERAYELALYSTTWGLLGAILAALLAALYGGMALFVPMFTWTVLPLAVLGIVTLTNYSFKSLNKFAPQVAALREKYSGPAETTRSELENKLALLIAEHELAYQNQNNTPTEQIVTQKIDSKIVTNIETITPQQTQNIELLNGAIIRGETAKAKNLLNTPGINLDVFGSNGRTPLMEAAYSNDDILVKELVKQGANLEVVDKDGLNALMHATINGSVKSIESLISAGAKIDPKTPTGTTVLMLASNGDKIPAAALAELLKSATVYDINAQDNTGQTALIKAAIAGKLDKVTMLIGAGANKDIEDFSGKNAVESANFSKHEKIADYLLADKKEIK